MLTGSEMEMAKSTNIPSQERCGLHTMRCSPITTTQVLDRTIRVQFAIPQ